MICRLKYGTQEVSRLQLHDPEFMASFENKARMVTSEEANKEETEQEFIQGIH